MLASDQQMCLRSFIDESSQILVLESPTHPAHDKLVSS